MYVVAHQDDTLLFQSPALLQDIESGRCVRTVFLTAGDSDRPASYWEGREEGVEDAYAQMADADDDWNVSQIDAAGRSVRLETLEDDPSVSVVFMRLPSGGVDGLGIERYEFQSPMKLWNSGNGGSPASSSIGTVDDSATYGYQGLINALRSMMESFEPRQVATQNYTEDFVGPDHADHVAAAYFTQAASSAYAEPHRLRAFGDYETSALSQNVFGDLLDAKSLAFYAYGAHDDEACDSEESCEDMEYAKWLRRQYVVASETTGVVADAGFGQITSPDAEAILDGSESSAEDETPLEYEWTQVGGPDVELSGADTVSPSLTMPSHPTLLTFSLIVGDGSESSEPDFVEVRAPSSDPTPAADAGPDQTVASAAEVELDGSASWDPSSLPLEYAWLQIAGPEVALSDPASATPSLTAPAGPATLTFSLAVSNGVETSEPSTMTVEVGEGPRTAPPAEPPGGGGRPIARLSRSRVRLVAGRSSRRLIRVVTSPGARIGCRGFLPRGARCRVNRDDVVVEGSPALRRAGAYRLTVRISHLGVTVRRSLTVVVRAQR